MKYQAIMRISVSISLKEDTMSKLSALKNGAARRRVLMFAVAAAAVAPFSAQH